MNSPNIPHHQDVNPQTHTQQHLAAVTTLKETTHQPNIPVIRGTESTFVTRVLSDLW